MQVFLFFAVNEKRSKHPRTYLVCNVYLLKNVRLDVCECFVLIVFSSVVCCCSSDCCPIFCTKQKKLRNQNFQTEFLMFGENITHQCKIQCNFD